MLHLTIHQLNGEILIVHHHHARGLSGLIDDLYRSNPDIPIGCLTLRRILHDHDYDLFDDEALFRRLGETIPEDQTDPSIVTHLYDQMHLFLLVDPSLVVPSLVRAPTIVFYTHSPLQVDLHNYLDDPRTYLDRFDIEYHTTLPIHDPHTESNVILTLPFVANHEHTRFALFHDLDMRPASHSTHIYVPKPSFLWYPSLTECIRASTLSIPRHDTSILHIQSLFDNQSWYDATYDYHQDQDHDEYDQYDQHDQYDQYDHDDQDMEERYQRFRNEL